MKRLYRQFIKPGDLCFDIGSHIGNRAAVWHTLGARVVAVEPQPVCAALLKKKFRNRPAVTVLPKAVAAKADRRILITSSSHPTLSTISPGWVQNISRHYPEAGVRWDGKTEVEAVTLDQLITLYGMPDFIKIDVEGAEEEVLAGLSSPPKALSFEYLPSYIGAAEKCILLLQSLGEYEYNISPVETMRFAWEEWKTAEDATATLAALTKKDRSGDVYARLREP